MAAYLPPVTDPLDSRLRNGSLEPILKFGHVVPYHSVSRSLLGRATSEGLRIAGVTSLVDVPSLYPPPSDQPLPKPTLGSSVAFSPGARGQLPAVLGGSAARSSFDLDTSGIAATMAPVLKPRK